MDKIQHVIAASVEKVEVVNQPVPGMDKVLRVLAAIIEQSIVPLIKTMDKKLEIDLRTHEKISAVFSQLKLLEKQIAREKQRGNKTRVRKKQPLSPEPKNEPS